METSKKHLGLSLCQWRDALASDIDNIDDQIKQRQKSLERLMQKRDEIDALVDWLANNDLPPLVLRAIYAALSWNPHIVRERESL